MSAPNFIVLHPKDNVATAVADLRAGDEIRVNGVTVKLIENVPFGHKVALTHIAAGAPVLKYGESIGLATLDIDAGSCVHTQNVESQRGRGDLSTRDR
jgi:altronate dehydratase small subunit